jgi:hypothetical protein
MCHHTEGKKLGNENELDVLQLGICVPVHNVVWVFRDMFTHDSDNAICEGCHRPIVLVDHIVWQGDVDERIRWWWRGVGNREKS